MKQATIRTCAVLLVLLLLVGIMPSALAATTPPVSVEAEDNRLLLERGSASTELVINWTTPSGYEDPEISIRVLESNATVTPSSIEDDSSGSETVRFSASKTGTYTVRVDATFAPETSGETVKKSDRCEIVVYDEAYTVTLLEINPVKLGTTADLSKSLEVWDNLQNSAYHWNYRDVEWHSSNERYVEVDDWGEIEAIRTGGYSDITATVTIDGEEYSDTCRITVIDELSCDADGESVPVGDSITLEPEYGDDVDFTYDIVEGEEIAMLSRDNGPTSRLTADDPGVVQVEITAWDGYEELDTITVTVSFYEEIALEAQLANGESSITFGDDDVFTKVKYSRNGRSDTITSKFDSLAEYMTSFSSSYYYVDITVDSDSKGKLTPSGSSLKNLSLSRLDDVEYTPGNGALEAYYTVYDDDYDLPVTEGKLTLQGNAAAGDILYSTDYSTAITFDEEDFETFWTEATGKTASSLAYVTFAPSSSDWGTLYTAAKNGDEVTKSMEFEPNHTTDKNYYDLDAVTYVPYDKKYTAYTDTLEFTAHGTDRTEVEGQVVISLNSTVNTTITARGVVFGKGEITEVLQETFEENRDEELAYVTFYLPDVEEGTLYYNFTSALDKSLVRSDEEYYVDPEKNQKSLDLVAFVPAAGTYGKVTLYYKGYDATGEVSYSGSVTLTITQRTTSAAFTDVTKSYSWAADSVDFLYYEEIAQGSNGKYNPGSSITRGDFMLMLYRAFLEDDYEDHNVSSNFSDVTKGSSTYSKETYQAVGVAKYLGIAQGSNGKFNPTSPITREEAMTLIYRTMDKIDWELTYESYTRASSFSDYSSISSYAKDAITELVSHGVIQGSNGKITPKSNITRAEMACILHRVLTY